MMPEEIEYLHHLRYMRFSVLNVKLLPRSLSSLNHLQFIKFDHHEQRDISNESFWNDMSHLLNLRYLTYSKLNFPGIGKLKFLQELKKFSIKNENGYKIEELEQMNDLLHLDLNNLNDVRDAEQAYNAKLCDKRKLTHFSLNWGNGDIANRDLHERVLDNLQPHNYLKELDDRGLFDQQSSENQSTVFDWLEWEILPPFGQLPFLKTLMLEKMPKVKRFENKFHGNDIMCSVFPSLEPLVIGQHGSIGGLV